MTSASCNGEQIYTYEKIKSIADHILAASKHQPKIGIICGSGLGGLADTLVDSEVFPYESVPGLPVTSISFHAGKIVMGNMLGVPVMCMQGRVHYYEGHPLWKCTLIVRVMKLMGITDLIVTCAAGGLNPNYKIGDIMVLKDHVNFQNFGGNSPLRGLNDPRFGPQYLSMVNAYDVNLRNKAKEIAKESGFSEDFQEGVYTMMTGPMFETEAELKALKILGVDAVGMSTIPEVIVGRHCGMRVFSFAIITNICVIGDQGHEVTDVEVCQVGDRKRKEVTELVNGIVEEMTKEQSSKNPSSS